MLCYLTWLRFQVVKELEEWVLVSSERLKALQNTEYIDIYFVMNLTKISHFVEQMDHETIWGVVFENSSHSSRYYSILEGNDVPHYKQSSE